MIFVIGEPVRLASERQYRFILRIAVFGVAAVCGGSAVGATVGAAATLLPNVALWAAAGSAAVFALLHEAFPARIPMPQRRWQLPRNWLTPFWRGAAVFGSAMGVGLFTYTPSAIFYLYLAGCLVAGSVGLSSLLGGLYGLFFFLAVIYGTIAWRYLPAGDQAPRAIALGRRAQAIGLAAAPVIAFLPGAWPPL
ncbi:MAG TPA: hypothetical protein VFJ93_05335 [Gaiellaceae bacterium]|jgi:hypothetical protein|nr:hypothetical protein [Gaiellaceae bacterium]